MRNTNQCGRAAVTPDETMVKAVDEVMEWLDRRIAETKAIREDDGRSDSMWLITEEQLRVFQSTHSHMDALRGSAEYTIRHLREWCGTWESKEEETIGRMMASGANPYCDAMDCATTRQQTWWELEGQCRDAEHEWSEGEEER